MDEGIMDINKVLNEMQGATPTDVSTILMHYVVNNFDKKDRMNSIHGIIRFEIQVLL